MATPLRLQILLFQNRPGNWVARSLEHEFVAEAPSPIRAHQSLLRLVRAHLEFDQRHHVEPLSSFRPAPRSYWRAFAQAAVMTSGFAQDDAGWGDIPVEIIAAVIHDYPALDLG